VRRYKGGFPRFLGVVDLAGLVGTAAFEKVHIGVFDMLEKGSVKVVGGRNVVPPARDGWALNHPQLFEHLTLDAWGDGSVRKTSSVTIFVTDGQFKAVLKDKEESLCLWMAAAVFEDLFAGLELALGDPATVWRQDRADNEGNSKRVQKGR
jgi:hypothetical protein